MKNDLKQTFGRILSLHSSWLTKQKLLQALALPYIPTIRYALSETRKWS